MQFGFAQVEITPPPGEEMTGYGYYLNRRAVGTADPLCARAMALSDGDSEAVVVQLDLLALDRHFVAEIRAECLERHGLLGEMLMLHCTHTHSGPAARITHGCGRPSEHFLHDLKAHILHTVSQALADLRPAAAMERFCVSFPEGPAHNRVGGADLDDHIRGIRIRPEGARPIVLMNYGCHPVTLGVNREYSADYPGALIHEFNAYGDRALFLTGCSGDINPLTNALRHRTGNSETVRIYGRDMAAATRRGLQDAVPWEAGKVTALSEMAPLECKVPPVDELQRSLADLREQLQDDPDDGSRRADVEWHEKMLADYAAGTMDQEMAAEIQVIACGDVAFVGLSAETFTKLGDVIRAAAPDKHVIIGATSNGVVGYISDARDAENKGYAAFSAAKLYGMPLQIPGAGEAWADRGAEILKRAVDAT